MISRSCLVLMLARFLADPVIYFVIFWLPAYLQKERGFDLEMIGRYAWIPYVFGGFGYVVGGWLSGRLLRAGWSLCGARKLALAAGAVLLPTAILAPLVHPGKPQTSRSNHFTLGQSFRSYLGQCNHLSLM